MMKRHEVEYLCFEGGGGKGLAYIGAIRALETKGILPLPGAFPPPVTRPIHGISGASAGAMTAFPVALGYNSDVLWSFFDDPAIATDLFEDVEIGLFVQVKYGKGSEFFAPKRDYGLENKVWQGAGLNGAALMAFTREIKKNDFGIKVAEWLNLRNISKAKIERFVDSLFQDAALLVGMDFEKLCFELWST
jgi:hypothetical protein